MIKTFVCVFSLCYGCLDEDQETIWSSRFVDAVYSVSAAVGGQRSVTACDGPCQAHNGWQYSSNCGIMGKNVRCLSWRGFLGFGSNCTPLTPILHFSTVPNWQPVLSRRLYPDVCVCVAPAGKVSQLLSLAFSFFFVCFSLQFYWNQSSCFSFHVSFWPASFNSSVFKHIESCSAISQSPLRYISIQILYDYSHLRQRIP